MTPDNQPCDTERRKFKRISVDCNVLYSINHPPEIRLKFGDSDMEATMLDLSEGGTALLTNHEIPVATQMEIKFRLTHNEKIFSIMTSQCEVRHCAKLDDPNTYRVGIQFNKIEAEDRQRIVEFIESVSTSWFYPFIKKLS